MSQIHPVQVLLDEHQIIEGVLNAFGARLRRRPRGAFPAEWFNEAVSFFRHFVEGCHESREEELIFPRLQVPALLEEHKAGTDYLTQLETSLAAVLRGNGAAVESFRRQGLAYIRFLRQHIDREDEWLHRLALEPLAEEEILRLQEDASPERFHHVDQKAYDRCVALAEKLSRAEAA